MSDNQSVFEAYWQAKIWGLLHDPALKALHNNQKWSDFDAWIDSPTSQQQLTAGFPNVLVLVLPEDAVKSAMQTANQTLKEEWRNLSNSVLKELQTERHWMPDLKLNSKTWAGWLDAQWQTYWTALPIGKQGVGLKTAAIELERQTEFQPWLDAQNQAYNLIHDPKLFREQELDFLRAACQQRLETQGRRFSVNVGSWWGYIFDQTRIALTSVKNARTWQIPTAFGSRSTISGIGPIVHPSSDWLTEKQAKQYWQQHVGLFDGKEQLNATETVKRGLHKVLPKILNIEQNAVSYPDLTAGVAGYLKVNAKSGVEAKQHFDNACQAILDKFDWVKQVIHEMEGKWGIPLVDSNPNIKYHPRLLNAGWLIEDAEDAEIKQLQQNLEREQDAVIVEELSQEIQQVKLRYRTEIQKVIDQYYPQNNPADWYVLAAGDGDGMSEWLKGKHLKHYQDYLPSALKVSATVQDSWEKFITIPKRMGPATHNALSRALLDFSNQLLPYLTEQRYTGRLIYGGGDDVLAYTNLWEWDDWLWDVRQCFRGDKDPHAEFDHTGNYWRWQGKEKLDSRNFDRPCFTMGNQATISFGVIIAHHSVPLAIALENLWEAEKQAKEHFYLENDQKQQKDAVQVRVIYGNGNILQVTCKFSVFHQWRSLLNATTEVDSAIFEQAATLWSQHPAPIIEAIAPWTQAFCDRRDLFKGNEDTKIQFQQHLAAFLNALWLTNLDKNLMLEIQTWLKLAAFVLRNRDIKLGRVQ